MPGLRIAVDLNGLDADRPHGPDRYARRLVEELRAASLDPIEVWEPGEPMRAADVVVSLGGRPRLRRDVPTVAAVYDLAHLLAPSTLGPLERTRRAFEVAWLTRQAAHLLAPSRSIAAALTTYLRVPDAHLTWLPNLGPDWKRSPRAEAEAARAEARVAGAYVLFVGSVSKRKSLPVLLAAWDRVCGVLGDQLELVLCGAGTEELRGRPGVRGLGYVSTDRLRALLSGATAWVSTSRAEGCAIGAVEAMTMGAPPIVAAGTALAEVVGSAGVVVAPDDVDGWAAAVTALARDTADRNRMAARGLVAMRDLRAAEAAARCLRAAQLAAGRTQPAVGGPAEPMGK